MSAVMALVTSVALATTIYMRYGPEKPNESLGLGESMPPLRLRDLETLEPLVLVGLKGKVVWVSFWDQAKGEDLLALEKATDGMKSRKKFTVVVAAVDERNAAAFRKAVAEAKVGLPTYLASEETRKRFGAEGSSLPLHVLVDREGKVGAVAHGSRPETLKRLEDQAERWLDEMEPPGASRFASMGGKDRRSVR
ncbi:TlpA family protein disulfide reductase [Singulisphaera sp. PoT]|uniref:TlpA family protein disulfide reductase n=1 Tax=Singulisphaera sp. PoT TaxID=3411797 RepID=UPI003BF603BE